MKVNVIILAAGFLYRDEVKSNFFKKPHSLGGNLYDFTIMSVRQKDKNRSMQDIDQDQNFDSYG